MRKLLFAIILLIFTACNKNIPEEKIEKPYKKLAPLEVGKKDYDTFYLKGVAFNLPASYDQFKNEGIRLNKNEYFHETIGKNQQVMANLTGDSYDLGATFKNSTNQLIETADAKITEIYVNSYKHHNQDFQIAGLSFGDSFSKAKESLSALNIEETELEDERTINYYTDTSYVSLFFEDDQLASAAIFSKAFMRDENYVGGEFVIFGQNMKFPMTLKDLEETLGTKLDFDGLDILEAGEEQRIRIYSPVADTGGVIINIINPTNFDINYKDAQVVNFKSEDSADLSVGNIYVGAPIEDLKKVDKKNQNPQRLATDGKNIDGKVKFTFQAENSTRYIFLTDGISINEIEVINDTETKEQP